MKVVIQRSRESSVKVDGKIVGKIDHGLVLLVCFENGDTKEQYQKAAEKIANLRIFENESGRMGLSIRDIDGKILAISQFTLSWDGKKGNRPSFDGSMEPRSAQIMFRLFCDQLRSHGVPVETGEFGKKMDVSIQNDGPVTFSFSF